MHIVFASDQNFVRPLTTASGSAVYASRNGGGGLVVHVLDCGITDASWAEYEAVIKRLAAKSGVNAEVVRHVIDMKAFENYRGWTNGSKATWARILIPTLLSDVDRCVYSDCDMLFIADPREMLEALDDSRVFLAGHHDPFVDAEFNEATWCRERGLAFDIEKYLCAGLIAMNLKAFREDGLVEKCFAFMGEHPNQPYRDQTTLNFICRDHRAFLSPGWGLLAQECFAFDGRIKAIHLTGGCGWPFPKPKSWYHAMWLSLSKDVFALWHDFEARILELSLLPPVRPALKLRLKAFAVLSAARVANSLGITIGNGGFQKIVAGYDARTPALANARRELFGD